MEQFDQQKREEESRRQLYLEQQKARMAQRLPESGAVSAVRPEATTEAGSSFQAEQARDRQAQRLPEGPGKEEKEGEKEKKKTPLKKLKALSEKLSEELEAGKEAIKELLKQCWTGLIPCFGLPLIWINIHFFLRHLVGIKFFCQFGEEWLPAGPAGALLKRMGAGEKIRLAEIIALIFLDLLVLFAILGILTIIYFMVTPTETFKLLWSAIWE